MKLKTSKSCSKRIIKITKSGKILRRSTSSQHLAANKSKRTKQGAGNATLLSKTSHDKIKKLMPYN